MKLKQLSMALTFCLVTIVGYSQSTEELIMMSSEIPDTLTKSRFPNFYSNYVHEKLNDKEIKGVYFGDFTNHKGSPAFNVDGYIFIDQVALLKNNRMYENAVLWKFYQSIGSIHYRNVHPKIDSLEFIRSKFTFALLKAKTLAESYNCGVLQAAISNIKYLTQNSKDKYVLKVAIDYTNDPVYQDYISFAKNCATKSESLEPIKNNTYSPTNNGNTKNVVTTHVLLNDADVDIILKDFKVRYDKFTEISYYYDRSSPKSPDNDGVYFYIVRYPKNKFELRLRVQMYINDYFKMLPRCLLKADDELYEIRASHSEQTFSNTESYGSIDIPATEIIINNVIKLTTSTDPMIRCYGIGEKTDNRKMKSREIDALKDVLAVYNILKGK